MRDETPNVRVVGIGASAGAMDPLKEFFHAMPADSGLAFVLIQHLDPAHVSYMADILARQTAMKVVQASDGMAVNANHVYTIPPNKYLSIQHSVLHLSEPIKRAGVRLPIDFFFRSLAQEKGPEAIGVLFSGGGSDGTLGIRESRGAGGLVIVQHPDTAQFDSMIESAIATGLVDVALPVSKIPGKLLQYVQGLSVTAESHPQDIDDVISPILELVFHGTRRDFRNYKKTTVRRRIERRMGLCRVNDIADYYRFLCDNPAEQARLAADMLIGVTSFFRDVEAFAELSEKVIAPLIGESATGAAIRAWIVGCTTGEEAYSVAILFMEEMARAKKNPTLQIFASDIDQTALNTARAGIYPASIAADVSEERLNRFFIKKDGTYQINPQIRKYVTFAEHNVISDPPFLRLDLISCRNLLIYVEPEVQKKVLNLFGFALKPSRYLLLDKSDTTIDDSEVFEPLSRSWRIFQRRQSFAAPVHAFPTRSMPRMIKAEEKHPVRLGELNQQVLLRHFDASIVLVNDAGEIVHFYGDTYRYLAHSYGEANLSLYSMVDRQKSVALRLAVEQAQRTISRSSCRCTKSTGPIPWRWSTSPSCRRWTPGRTGVFSP